MEVVRSKKALKDAIRACRSHGKRIALVPTMGALHAGHISLTAIAAQHADHVAVSIFVNPSQFGPNEDFEKYPRTEEEDICTLEAAGVAIVYLPTVEEMYPPGAVTRVHVPGISSDLEGVMRPGHFDGVATIITKLFLQVFPEVAVFGEKDYQQLCVIRSVVRDLDMHVRIIAAPTLREADGLAMSSRNRYLTGEERDVAASLYQVLCEAKAALEAGREPRPTLDAAKQELMTAGFAKIDYLALRNAENFAPMDAVDARARLLAAAHLGTTRLIDNLAIG